MRARARLPGDTRGECRSTKRPALSCNSGSTSDTNPANRRERGREVGVCDRKQVCICSEVGLGCGWAPQIIAQGTPTTQAQGPELREGVKGTKKVYFAENLHSAFRQEQGSS